MRNFNKAMLIASAALCLNLSGFSQNISLSVKDVTVKEAMEQLKKSSGYSFVFSSSDVDTGKRVSVSGKNASIEEVIKQILQGQSGLDYEIQGKKIIVKRQSVQAFSAPSDKKITVKGKVLDVNGEPIIGAAIKEVGTTNGTITDFDGNFSFEANDNGTLEVSYVGYKMETLKAEANRMLAVTMKEDTETLDEVVVIGYGTVKKRDLTGSVASIANEDLVANPVSNVSQALQGKLAGVSVVSQDGRPGAEVSVRIRGGGSISQSNEPLYIVDGFPVNSISDIPADQIVSIDVLKDASSTAIYGARGANGVILVTTKSAKEGKTTITYNGYFQTKWAADKPQSMSVKDYVKNTWAFGTTLGMGDNMAKYFGLGSAYGNHWNEYSLMELHNYTDDMLRSAHSWNHNLTINGGSEKTKASLAVNYLDDDGIKINSSYERLAMNLKVKQYVAENLDLDVDVRYLNSKIVGQETSTSFSGSLLSSAYQFRPVDVPLGDGDDTLFGMGSSFVEPSRNPVDITNCLYQMDNEQYIRGNFALNWKIIEGLTARTELALEKGWNEVKNYDNGSVASAYTKGYKYARLENEKEQELRSVTTLNYDVLGLGNNQQLSFLLGNEIIKSESSFNEMVGAGYPMSDEWDMDRVFGMLNMYDPTKTENKFNNTINVPSATASFFARANYTLLDKYLFTVTFRADGSSKFGPNHRWGYFPAGAFAWRISDEDFFKSISSVMNNFKLRLSYGLSGADNIDPSLWRETWTASSIAFDGNTVSTYKPGDLMANPDLKWETTISRNLGFDLGFFENKLSGTLDFYWNTTKDLLMRQEIDSSTGYSYQYRNIGKTSNKGVELALNYHVYSSKDFNMNISATYNYNKNNIDELMGGQDIYYSSGWGSNSLQPTYDYVLSEGQAVGVIRGFKSAGFYKVEDFDFVNGMYILKDGIPDISTSLYVNYPKPSELKVPEGQAAFPGALKVEDVDNSGYVDLNDVMNLGEVRAKHTGGFSLSGNYKNFDFNANFTYQIGGKVYNCASMGQLVGQKESGLGRNKYDWVANAFQLYDVVDGELMPVTEPEKLIELNRNAKYPVPFYEGAVVLSDFVEDASYLRLSDLTIGYTLPKKWSQKAYIQRARVYVTGGNLFCITGYSGLDPEVNADTKRNDAYPTLGLDFGSYMRARTITIGLNIEF